MDAQFPVNIRLDKYQRANILLAESACPIPKVSLILIVLECGCVADLGFPLKSHNICDMKLSKYTHFVRFCSCIFQKVVLE